MAVFAVMESRDADDEDTRSDTSYDSNEVDNLDLCFTMFMTQKYRNMKPWFKQKLSQCVNASADLNTSGEIESDSACTPDNTLDLRLSDCSTSLDEGNCSFVFSCVTPNMTSSPKIRQVEQVLILFML